MTTAHLLCGDYGQCSSREHCIPRLCWFLQSHRFNASFYPRASCICVDCICFVLFRLKGVLLANDTVMGATAGPNRSSVLTGYAKVNSGSLRGPLRQRMAAKLDADGTLQWRWQVNHMSHVGGQAITRRLCVTKTSTFEYKQRSPNGNRLLLHSHHTPSLLPC